MSRRSRCINEPSRSAKNAWDQIIPRPRCLARPTPRSAVSGAEKMFEEERFEDVLKSLRVRRGKIWTQARTAQSLGVSVRTYVRWENGENLPQSRDLKNIAATFELSDAETDVLF